VAHVESITHAGVTVTLVRTDPPGVIPAKWYQARKYDMQWFDVLVSRVEGDQGQKVGGVERFKTVVGPRAKPTSLGTPGPSRQVKQFRWRYYTDDYKPATRMEYTTRRTALEDLLRTTSELADLQRPDIKVLASVGANKRLGR